MPRFQEVIRSISMGAYIALFVAFILLYLTLSTLDGITGVVMSLGETTQQWDGSLKTWRKDQDKLMEQHRAMMQQLETQLERQKESVKRNWFRK